MQSLIHRIGNAITSISAVILVLMLTIVAMIFFSHTVFYETLPGTMATWERQVAAWAIACSWELTILVVVCNTELLLSKRIPIALSICSGFVILFFIHAFEPVVEPIAPLPASITTVRINSGALLSINN